MRIFYVYILTDRSRRIVYTGMTNHLERRLHEHSMQRNEGAYSARYGVHYLVYFETHSRPSEAYAREREIKQMSRAERDQLIEAFAAEENACPPQLRIFQGPPTAVGKRVLGESGGLNEGRDGPSSRNGSSVHNDSSLHSGPSFRNGAVPQNDSSFHGGPSFHKGPSSRNDSLFRGGPSFQKNSPIHKGPSFHKVPWPCSDSSFHDGPSYDVSTPNDSSSPDDLHNSSVPSHPTAPNKSKSNKPICPW